MEHFILMMFFGMGKTAMVMRLLAVLIILLGSILTLFTTTYEDIEVRSCQDNSLFDLITYNKLFRHVNFISA